MPSIFAVANPKGGSGKTTVAIILAGEFARHGYAVAIDLHRQALFAGWPDRPSGAAGVPWLRDAAGFADVAGTATAAEGPDRSFRCGRFLPAPDSWHRAGPMHSRTRNRRMGSTNYAAMP